MTDTRQQWRRGIAPRRNRVRRYSALLFGTVLVLWTILPAGSDAAEANNSSFNPAISGDGRFVAFWSVASNLVPGDTNNTFDIFVHDRSTGTTERVSVDSAGAQGNLTSSQTAISADGRFVAFGSRASNLVPGDTNGQRDVFVRDRVTGTTERVSVDSASNQGNSHSFNPAISADGRFVAFDSVASNLVPGDTNNAFDIFVHDRQTGDTERVSVDSASNQGNSRSFFLAISADGRFVAFTSFATNLVLGDTNGTRDVFVRDRLNGTTERVSVNSAGNQGNGHSRNPAISADGRFVAFSSGSTNLVPDDSGSVGDVFVRDRVTGTTERVSVDSASNQGNSSSVFPAISADGRFVAFESVASNLVPGDTNGHRDVFVHDRVSGTTERVSVDSAGNQQNARSEEAPTISADGRFVAFESVASNLVPGDTNGAFDVFVHDRDTGTTERVSVGTQEPMPDLPDPPPQPEPPMAGEPEGDIDPAKDVTVVITHGLQRPGDEPIWMYQMRNDIESLFPAANVVAWRWRDADTNDPLEALSHTGSAAASLLKYLRTNALLSGRLHLIGHSLGNWVNAYTALLAGAPVDQVTILDRPFGHPGDILVPNESELFAEYLVQVAWIDNYYGTDREPILGDGAKGNPLRFACNFELVGRDHPGVHEWYRDTIVDAAEEGFYWSLLGGGADSRPNPPCMSIPELELKFSPLAPVDFSPWDRFNVAGTTPPVLVEGSPAYLWSDLTVPPDAGYLEFEFRWDDAGDGDFLTLHFGDDLLFNYLGTVFGDDGFVSSGPIPVSQYAGQTGQLLFSLNSVGDPNAEVAIRNLRFYEVSGATMTPAKDSFIYTGPPDRNEGANPRLQVQTGGMHRALVAFDPTTIEDFVTEQGVSRATLALTVADVSGNWGSGRDVDADPLLEDFAEGNGKRNGLSISDSFSGEGAGVTWRCAVDTDISNQQTDCEDRWDGGSFASPTAPPVVHVNGLSGQVDWDVTDDVLAGDTAWLIKNAEEQGGGTVLYYSKEGAIEAGNVDLAPRLILER